jgi:hypothetical protein
MKRIALSALLSAALVASSVSSVVFVPSQPAMACGTQRTNESEEVFQLIKATTIFLRCGVVYKSEEVVKEGKKEEMLNSMKTAGKYLLKEGFMYDEVYSTETEKVFSKQEGEYYIQISLRVVKKGVSVTEKN